MNPPQTNPTSTITMAKDMVNDLKDQLEELDLHLEVVQTKIDNMMKKKKQVMKLLGSMNVTHVPNKSISNNVKRDAPSSDQLRINDHPSNGKGYLVTEEEMLYERCKYNLRKRNVKKYDHPGKKKLRLNDEHNEIDIDLTKDSHE